MTERRQHSRRRTFLAGRLEIAKLNGWTLACTVKNLSETGARLAIPGEIVVPQNLDLTVSDGPRRPARLIWYREGHAGFALTDRRTAPRAMPASADNDDAGAARLAERIAAIAGGRSARPAIHPRFTGI